MPDPATLAAFNARYEQNIKIEGFGLDGDDSVRTVSPCFFCAAPDFATWHINKNEADMEAITTCRECGRSGHVHVDHPSHAAAFFQTAGPDAPAYLGAIVRRCGHHDSSPGA